MMSPTSPFLVLARAFFAQFMTSESATSEAQLRQAMILGLTCLFPPGVFLMVSVFPEYENLVLYHPALVDQARLRMALILVMYAMASIGYIAVFVWDGLAFERRDAMVVGPLPLRGATIIGAKLAALATLLLGAALSINLLTAVPFGAVTANHEGTAGFFRDGAALFATTVGSATFVFTSLVVMRTLVMLLGTPRLAARLGSLLQFLFVAGILCFVALLPVLLGVKRTEFLDAAPANPNPAAWFLGLFEHLHGSPEPGFAILATRALIALTLSVGGAIGLSIVGVRQQMRRALVPVASAGALGRAPIARAIAHLLTRRDPVGRATADFILLTIARNRVQQGPIAISAAIGLAVLIATLSGVSHPGTAGWHLPPAADLLSLPLVLGYWIAIGVRASFFVPSELPAAWSFAANAPEARRSYWSATRAAMLGFVVPPILAATALLTVVLDWRLVAGHAAFVATLLILLVEALTLTIDHIPFVRPYEPGHARLRTRWPIYLFGMYLFAYGPVRPELRLLTASSLTVGGLLFVVSLVAMVILLDAIGRRRALRWLVEEPEQSVGDSERLSVLDLGATVAR